jgi:hypothetical protein
MSSHILPRDAISGAHVALIHIPSTQLTLRATDDTVDIGGYYLALAFEKAATHRNGYCRRRQGEADLVYEPATRVDVMSGSDEFFFALMSPRLMIDEIYSDY